MSLFEIIQIAFGQFFYIFAFIGSILQVFRQAGDTFFIACCQHIAQLGCILIEKCLHVYGKFCAFLRHFRKAFQLVVAAHLYNGRLEFFKGLHIFQQGPAQFFILADFYQMFCDLKAEIDKNWL